MKVKHGVSYKEVLEKPAKKQRKPNKPSFFFRTLIRTVSMPDLWATHFKYESIGMEKLSKKEPCLILMNHSSFIDLEIVSRIFYPRKYNIVCTSDGFIGKALSRASRLSLKYPGYSLLALLATFHL